jgi:hypothetical protein
MFNNCCSDAIGEALVKRVRENLLPSDQAFGDFGGRAFQGRVQSWAYKGPARTSGVTVPWRTSTSNRSCCGITHRQPSGNLVLRMLAEDTWQWPASAAEVDHESRNRRVLGEPRR